MDAESVTKKKNDLVDNAVKTWLIMMDRQSRALVLTTGRGIAFEKRAMSRRAADDDEVEVVVVEEEVEDDGTELILPGGAAALLSADASASHTACADRRFRVGLFVGLFVVFFFWYFYRTMSISGSASRRSHRRL